jgi:hydroxymethylglutaryl-CoA synthase
MAVAQPHEDPVALAANAARRLFATADVDPASIGLVVVGTETAVPSSLPLAYAANHFSAGGLFHLAAQSR